MKYKRYERKELLIFFSCCLLFLEILFFFQLGMKKMPIYESLEAVVQKQDLVLLIVNQEQLEIIYHNHYLFINDKKKKYNVRKVTKNVLKRKNIKYHEVLLEFSFSTEKKEQDVFSIAISKEKIRGIDIFKVIWEGVKV